MKQLLYLTLTIMLISACDSGTTHTEKRKLIKKRSALSIMRTNDCFVCHSIEDHVDIPSYQMIAERYGNDMSTVKTLKKKVLEGGGGNWGNALMVKHPFIKEHEVESIIKWILSLDSDSVIALTALKESVISEKQDHSFRIESFTVQSDKIKFTDTVFVGSSSQINLTNSSIMSANRFIRISGSLDITRRGKYFFKLLKTGLGTMYRGKNIIISDRADDHEIMLELEKGVFPFRIEYYAENSRDTLALFWLPPGKEYYEPLK